MQWDALKGISSAKLQGHVRKRYTSYLCGHSAARPGIRMVECPRTDFAICSIFAVMFENPVVSAQHLSFKFAKVC